MTLKHKSKRKRKKEERILAKEAKTRPPKVTTRKDDLVNSTYRRLQKAIDNVLIYIEEDLEEEGYKVTFEGLYTFNIIVKKV